MEDLNNKKMMNIINRRRKLSGIYLAQNASKSLAGPSPSPKPSVVWATSSTAATVKDLVKENISDAAAKTPNLRLSMPSSPPSVNDSIPSTPDMVQQLGPRWWQRGSMLPESGETRSIDDTSNWKPPLPSPRLPSRTSWGLEGDYNVLQSSKVQESNFPRKFEGGDEQSFPAAFNVRGGSGKENLSKVNDRHSYSIGSGRSPGVHELQHSRTEDSSNFYYCNREVVDKFNGRRGFCVVPPPKRRVPLSEFYVGELVIVRTNRYVWQLANVQKLATTGMRVCVPDPRLVLNIPLELLYTHLRKLDDCREDLFPVSSFLQEGQPLENQRVFIQDKDLQEDNHCSFLNAIPSGRSPVHLVRPAHLAHRRLYRPREILSCIICYEGMSEMEAHFPWDCNHGSHLQCLELNSQHSISGSLARVYCPACMENIFRQQKLQWLQQYGPIMSASDVKSTTSAVESFRGGDSANDDIKSPDIDQENLPRSRTPPKLVEHAIDTCISDSNAQSMKRGLNKDFKASDWRSIQCECGFVGIVRKNVKLGLPPMCPTCLGPALSSWTPPEEDLIKTLVGELPSTSNSQTPRNPSSRSISPRTLSSRSPLTSNTPDHSLLSLTPRRHAIGQTEHHKQKEFIKLSRDSIERGDSSSGPPIHEIPPQQTMSQGKGAQDYESKRTPIATMPLGSHSQLKIQSKPCSKVLDRTSPISSKASTLTVGLDRVTDAGVSTGLHQVALTSTKDTSKRNINPLGPPSRPRWSSREKGKATLPTDSLSFDVNPMHILQKMEDLELSENSSTSDSMGNKQSPSQVNKEDDTGRDQKAIDLSVCERLEVIEQIRPSSSTTLQFATPTNTARYSRTDGMGPLGLRSSSSTGSALPVDSLPFYLTPKQIKQRMQENTEVSFDKRPMLELFNPSQVIAEEEGEGASYVMEDIDRGKESAVEILQEKLADAPSMTAMSNTQHPGLGMIRSKGLALPNLDPVSFHITPLQKRQTMNEQSNQCTSAVDHVTLVSDPHDKSSTRLNLAHSQEQAAKTQQQQSPAPSPMSSSQTSSQNAQASNALLETKIRGLSIPRPKGQVLPTDSLSFYIKPTQFKQQMAQLQVLEEQKPSEDGNAEDQSEALLSHSTATDTDGGEDRMAQAEESSLSFLKLSPLRVIPEDEAIPSTESSTVSSPDMIELESQGPYPEPSGSASPEPTSLATRLGKFKARRSKSEPSTPPHNPALGPSSSSAPSTPSAYSITEFTDGVDDGPKSPWITVRRS